MLVSAAISEPKNRRSEINNSIFEVEISEREREREREIERRKNKWQKFSEIGTTRAHRHIRTR